MVAGDPISAIVAEQEAIDAERAAKEKARLEALERSREAAVIPDGWTVQIGAFGVRENATAAAAHAEMMLSQQQQTGAGTVRVIDTGSMFRVGRGQRPVPAGGYCPCQKRELGPGVERLRDCRAPRRRPPPSRKDR